MIKKLEIKSDNKLQNLTSYHGISIIDSRQHLSSIFGCPRRIDSGDKKVTYMWEFVYTNEKGEEVGITLYDWKMSKVVTETARINWHIGSKGKSKAEEFAKYIGEKYNLEISSEDYDL